MLDVSLPSEDLSLTSANLLSKCCNLRLAIVIGTALFVEMVAGIVTFFLESLQGDEVGVVAGFEIIVLEHFLILKVSEFGLNCIELVAQGEIVLVPLLNFEYLSLKLTD